MKGITLLAAIAMGVLALPQKPIKDFNNRITQEQQGREFTIL
jgi:hypothetical protein